MADGCAPSGMIADYAAGTLSPGMSLLVASHLTYCPCCRDKAARLEALGGALLAASAFAATSPGCLERALARLADPAAPPPAVAPREPPLPRPLCRRLPPRLSDLPWQAVTPGLSACWLDGFRDERVGLVRADPGERVEPTAEGGVEATLVLDGRIRDRAGSYGCGEMLLAGWDIARTPEATCATPCLCLVVASPPRP